MFQPLQPAPICYNLLQSATNATTCGQKLQGYNRYNLRHVDVEFLPPPEDPLEIHVFPYNPLSLTLTDNQQYHTSSYEFEETIRL